MGLEPTTSAVTGRRSEPIELRPQSPVARGPAAAATYDLSIVRQRGHVKRPTRRSRSRVGITKMGGVSLDIGSREAAKVVSRGREPSLFYTCSLCLW